MGQYNKFTVNTTNGSEVVTGIGTQFLANVSPGNSFKIKDSPVVYIVASVTSDLVLHLSTPYQGPTGTSQQYQITRDFTTNFGFAEVHAGDQDWPSHLTQQTIKKIDEVLGTFSSGFTFKGNWNATTNVPAIPTAIPANSGWQYKVATAGSTNISGTSSWSVGDTLISNGISWSRIPSVEAIFAGEITAAVSSDVLLTIASATEATAQKIISTTKADKSHAKAIEASASSTAASANAVSAAAAAASIDSTVLALANNLILTQSLIVQHFAFA